ncbi:MAG: DUF1987 domain-containing protein [Bacteroidales bacterium]|nr:DUF1987 domain-containing protein [Bacteroidales bacterium]MDD4671637.1 DUF1987 domain-containing protein [Bacteroidales bacterium]MDY0349283.1 DUF1987 domain-containing protein [Tenuifilaceae bacterium]
MKALHIEPTDFTPNVNFNPENSSFEISGFSRPENAIGFYRPILKWLEEYNEKVLSQNTDFNKKLLTLNFKMTYFNSASSKFLLDILLEFMKFMSKGYEVEVNWYYEEGDDEIQESGEEMSDMVSFPFKFISYIP